MGQVELKSTAYKYYSSGVPSGVQNIACSGVNRYLVAHLAMDGGLSGLTVKYNNVPMTYLGAASVAWPIYMWGMVNPPTGTHELWCGWTTWRRLKMHLSSFEGVDQIDPHGTVRTYTNLSQNWSSITYTDSEVGDLIVDGVCWCSTTGGWIAVGAGQTTHYNNVSRPCVASCHEAGAGSVVTNYTMSASRQVQQIGMPLYALTTFPVSITMDELTLASSSPNIYPRMPVIMDPLTLTASPQMLIPSLPLADPAKMRNYRRARSVGPVTVYE